MPEKSARPRRWTAGALRVARATALLTVATGINGTLSAYFSRYEPFYVYLISVVLVAWLSGVLLGVTTAVAAVIFYDWYFSPLVRPSVSTVVPLIIAVGAAVVTQLARRPVRASLHRPAAAPPLLVGQVSAGGGRRDQQLADLEQRLASARAAAETEGRLRAELLHEARTREAALEREMETMRAAAADQSTRAAALRRDVELAKQRNLDLDGRLAAVHEELEVAYRRVDEERSRAEQARAQSAELQDIRQALVEERARADREAHLRAQLEQAARQTLQKTADVAASHQRAGDAAQAALRKAEQQIAEMEARRTEGDRDAAARLAAAESRSEVLQQELERVRVILDDETARADRETELREQLEIAGHEKLQQVVTDLAAKYEGALSQVHEQLLVERTRAGADKERAQTESRALEERLAELQTAADERDELRTALASVSEQHEAAQREARTVRHSLAELEGAMAELTARYEAAVIAARDRELIENERKDLQRANERLSRERDQLRREIGEQIAAGERLESDHHAKLEAVTTSLTSRYEQALGEAIVEREAARAEARTLSSRIDSLEAALTASQEQLRASASELEAVRKEHEGLRAEYDAKLQSVVDRLTDDYQRSIGQALVDRESLRSEVQAMTARIAELENTLASTQAASRDELARAASEHDRNLETIVAGITSDYEQAVGELLVEKEAARAEVRSLNSRVEQLQRNLAAATASAEETRTRLEAEWSEKLQKIVTGLASDHEADLGSAMLEKEAAKAEVRRLSQKIGALQQKLSEDREQFRRLAERWRSERSELLRAQVESAPPPKPGYTSPLVLVVHSDAGVRAMAKRALEQSGYVVITAADGLEGLRMAGSEKPDVVLAEAVMPKMNGRELVQLLKSRPETATMKIVLMSGPQMGPFESASDFQADDFLQSPDDFAVMKATLANVLARGR